MSLLGHDPYYFETLKKMVVYFGTVFNEMTITRTDSSGNISHIMRVPMEYGPKDKQIARFDADPEINREAAVILPRMSFQFNTMKYVADRKRPDYSRYIEKNNTDLNKFRRQFQEVPYDFYFTLWVYAKNVEDGNKIVEQIVPLFTPEFTASVNIIPEMGISRDIPIVLDNVSYEDVYTGSLEDRRTIIWTLDFRLLGMMYGPIVNKPIIKLSNTNFYVGNVATTNTIIERIKVTPGLDANGNATTNAEVTIPYANIDVDDTWGYIVQFEQSDD